MTNSINIFGITPKDLLDIIVFCTPVTLYEILHVFPLPELDTIGTIEEFNAVRNIEELKEDKESGKIKSNNLISNISPKISEGISRLSPAWFVANTSLLLPSILLAVAAYFMLQATQDDKKLILQAANEERSTVLTEQRKLNEILSTNLKMLADYFAGQAQHYGQLNAMEIELMKARLAPPSPDRPNK